MGQKTKNLRKKFKYCKYILKIKSDRKNYLQTDFVIKKCWFLKKDLDLAFLFTKILYIEVN